MIRAQQVRPFALAAGLLLACVTASVAAEQIQVAPSFSTRGERSVQWEPLASTAQLSQDTVLDIAQDADGFMWFATQAGLNRYDGQRVQVFERHSDKPDSLPHNWVWELLIDRQQTLWAATNGGGAARFDAEHQTFTTLRHDPENPNSLSSDRVRALAVDADNGLWLGTVDRGLNHYDPASGTVTRYRHEPLRRSSLPDDAVQTLLVDATGRLWVGTDGGGLAYFDRPSQTFITQPALAGYDITALHMAGPDKLWIGTQNAGVFRLSLHAGGALEPLGDGSNSLGSDYVRDIYRDRSGTIWVATASGVAEWREQQQQFVRHGAKQRGGLPRGRVNRLFQSRDGVLWVGTHRGAARWNYMSDDFRYLRSDLLGHEDVTALAESSHGMLWVGTYGGGVTRLDRVARERTRYRHVAGAEPSLTSNRITALTLDGDGAAWVGTRYRGLNRIDPLSGQIEHWRRPDLASNRVTAIAADGDTVWVGTREGLTQIRRARDGSYATRSMFEGSRVNCLLLDRRGDLWVGTQRAGLLRYRPRTGDITRYRHTPDVATSLSSDSIRQIFESGDGSLWIGTASEGLNRWSAADRSANRAVFSLWLRQHGLASNSIASLTEDVRGYLWVATDRGLNRLPPGASPGRASILSFDDRTGLLGNAFNTGTAISSRSGALLFGTPQGALTFLPQQLRRGPRQIDVSLTTLADAQPIASSHSADDGSGKPLRIGHDHRLVEFEFAALDFTAPHQTHYRYQLIGVDEDWQDPGELRRISYARLPAGSYRFSIQATRRAGAWQGAPTTVAFEITPPPWLTWWAFLFYLAVAGGLITAMSRHFRRRRALELRYQRTLEEQVARRTRELDARNQELEALNVRVTEASHTDALTSLYNRRYVDQRLRAGAFETERRDAATLHFCMMIDLDGFKAINDEHGHTAGDRALLQVRDQLLDATRESDTVIRWGGDEFLIIGTVASVADLAGFAERVRLVITERRYRLGNGKNAAMSCSIGAVPLPFTGVRDTPGALGWEQAVMVADSAAYLVKTNGKNGWAVLSGVEDFRADEMSQLPRHLDTLRSAGRVRVTGSAGLKLTTPVGQRDTG